MIKKLRTRFVALSMCSLLLVLAVLVVSVNLLNYWAILEEADETVGMLLENKGVFPKMDGGFWHKSGKAMSPELPYETRYFTVVLTGAGNILTVDTGKIAAVDTETAIEYAKGVLMGGSRRGFVEDYRYGWQAYQNEVRVVFLDLGGELDTFRRFALTSGAISLACAAVVFVVTALVSGRIVKPVAESYEKQKRFITDAGHEIKTPLTIIGADADVLKMEIGENEWLRDIQKQTGKLTELTGSLITLSRMEEDGNRFRMIDFPLSDMVSETAQSFAALAETQGKRFSAAVRPMLSVKGDEAALGQLVTILLDNAVKYTPAGGEISLTLEKQGRGACLRVSNTAENVSRESLSHLFDRFYRADPSRNSRAGGYGLGLSIAQAIVSGHRGRITAASPDGKSLTMTVTLPE